MSNVFFTSDTHFGHALMLLYRRGLKKEEIRALPGVTKNLLIEEMDESLIAAWNSVVGRQDRVYHLGDVSLHKAPRTLEILSRLNGFIYLIKGNHEAAAENGICKRRFQWQKDYEYIKIGQQKIALCHYPMITWRSSHHRSWMLHGHCHGNLADDSNALRIDVGIDVHHRPISFEEVQAMMRKKRFAAVDHHGADFSDE